MRNRTANDMKIEYSKLVEMIHSHALPPAQRADTWHECRATLVKFPFSGDLVLTSAASIMSSAQANI